MKPPKYSWYVIENSRTVGNEIVVDLRVRKWHPGFWWLLLKAIFAGWTNRGESR
jgi:hypothetical protein